MTFIWFKEDSILKESSNILDSNSIKTEVTILENCSMSKCMGMESSSIPATKNSYMEILRTVNLSSSTRIGHIALIHRKESKST